MMMGKEKLNQTGFTLLEVMIAMTLGLVLLSGLTTIFVNNSQTYKAIQDANRLNENGHYSIQLLTDDLQLAGYFSEFNPSLLSLPAALPDACSTTLATQITALPLHIQGYNNATNLTKPTCLTEAIKPGTDILVIRRVSTCVAGSVFCEPITSGTPYFQASTCSNSAELKYPVTTNPADYINHHFSLDTNLVNLTRLKRDCTTTADLHRFKTHIYFIASNHNSGDGIPTLKRAELTSSGFSIFPLAEGVENMQIEYGINDVANGTPSSFSAAPATVSDWSKVVSVKIFLLLRNTTTTQGYIDSKTYSLDSAGTYINPCSGLTGNALTTCQGYKRHAYRSSVRLNNPSRRRM